MSDRVTVQTLPRCDFCGAEARFDFATRMGPWANGCERCYRCYRASATLGTGRGQRLVTPDEAADG
jgi:hypothetical protein